MPRWIRTCSPLVLAASLWSTLPAVAQPTPPPSPPTDVASHPPPPVADPGLAAFDQAYASLMAGDFATAQTGFTSVVAIAQDPELRGAARQLARLAADLQSHDAHLTLGATTETPSTGYEEDKDEGRTGFIVTTTLASIYTGAVLINLSDTDDARVGAAMLLGTTAIGFLASLFGTRNRTITSGTADAYSLGMMLGAGNALLLSEPLGADTSEEWQTGIIAGMAVTGAAGFLYGHAIRPTSGQVSFTGTLATLGIASAGLGLFITQPDVSPDTILYTMTAGLDLGTASGLVLGRDLTWSPGRARLVWLGALLGGLTGLGGGVIIAGNDGGNTTGRLIAAAGLVGTWGGFGLAVHFTRNMAVDRRFRTASIDAHLVPVAIEHGAGFGIAGQF